MNYGLIPGSLNGVLLDDEVERLDGRRVLEVLAVDAEREVQLDDRLAGPRAHHVHMAPHVWQLPGRG